MKWIVLLAMLVGLPGCTSIPEQGQGVGLGMRSCEEFSKAYKAQPALAETVYFTWAEGFMSGLSFMATAADIPPLDLKKIDADSAKTDIKSYCNAFPQAPYYDAIIPIYNRLPTISKPPETAPTEKAPTVPAPPGSG
jgi:hypothetical protein